MSAADDRFQKLYAAAGRLGLAPRWYADQRLVALFGNTHDDMPLLEVYCRNNEAVVVRFVDDVATAATIARITDLVQLPVRVIDANWNSPPTV